MSLYYDTVGFADCDDGGQGLTWTVEAWYNSPGGKCGNEPESVYDQSAPGLFISHAAPPKNVITSGELSGEWRESIRRGEIVPFTEYHVKSKRFGCEPARYIGACEHHTHRYKTRKTGPASAVSEVRIPFPPEVEAIDLDFLLQKAWAEVKSSGIDILTEMAEAPETIELFRSYAKGLKKRSDHVHRQARKRNRRNGRRRAAAIADRFKETWMETRYGWRPIVASAEEIVETWEDWKSSKPKHVKARKSRTTTSTDTVKGAVWFPYGTQMVFTNSSHSHTHTGRAVVITALVKGTVPASITINPLATAWELVPASFCVDWFLNTSDIFRAHWPSAFTGGSSACTSLKQEVALMFSYNKSGTSNMSDARFLYSGSEYHRAPRGDIPWSLKWDPRLSVEKLIDLTIVVEHMFARKIPRKLRNYLK